MFQSEDLLRSLDQISRVPVQQNTYMLWDQFQAASFFFSAGILSNFIVNDSRDQSYTKPTAYDPKTKSVEVPIIRLPTAIMLN